MARDRPRQRLASVAPGAVRRTLTWDIAPARGSWGRGARATGSARDVSVVSGAPRVHASYGLDIGIDAAGAVVAPVGSWVPRSDVLRAVDGKPARTGLRRLLAQLPSPVGADERLERALWDDLPGIVLVGGYAHVHDMMRRDPSISLPAPPGGACIGFAVQARSGPTSVAGAFVDRASAPDLTGGDPLAWHDDGALASGSVRRRRLLEVAREAGDVHITGYFRDTFHVPDGDEIVVHEYDVRAVLGGGDPLRVERLEVEPLSLPLWSCSTAVTELPDLRGTPLPDLEAIVRGGLRGALGCTHLTDELRSLGCAADLLGLLDA